MRLTLILALGTALCAGTALAAATAASSKAPAVDPSVRPPGWKTPRTAFGQPDLSGYWSNATLTPTIRNLKLSDKLVLPDAQALQMEATFAAAMAKADQPSDPNEKATDKSTDSKLLQLRPEFAAAGGDVGGYNAFWLDPGAHLMRVNGEYHTSLFTTPDGQVPKRKDGVAAGGFRRGGGMGSFDNPENRGLGERCVIGFGRNSGPPMLPNGFYNNNYQIVQTPGAIAIDVEMIHDTRIIRLNSQHRSDGVRPWMGDSIGHWEGDTLVVDTTNIPQAQNFFGSWKNLKVTEWFTRISPTRLLYRFQVEDPDTWAKPWGGEYEFAPLKGIVYEYACHEGNYALPSILAGARHAEQAAAKAKTGAD